MMIALAAVLTALAGSAVALAVVDGGTSSRTAAAVSTALASTEVITNEAAWDEFDQHRAEWASKTTTAA